MRRAVPATSWLSPGGPGLALAQALDDCRWGRAQLEDLAGAPVNGKSRSPDGSRCGGSGGKCGGLSGAAPPSGSEPARQPHAAAAPGRCCSHPHSRRTVRPGEAVSWRAPGTTVHRTHHHHTVPAFAPLWPGSPATSYAVAVEGCGAAAGGYRSAGAGLRQGGWWRRLSGGPATRLSRPFRSVSPSRGGRTGLAAARQP